MFKKLKMVHKLVSCYRNQRQFIVNPLTYCYLLAWHILTYILTHIHASHYKSHSFTHWTAVPTVTESPLKCDCLSSLLCQMFQQETIWARCLCNRFGQYGHDIRATQQQVTRLTVLCSILLITSVVKVSETNTET